MFIGLELLLLNGMVNGLIISWALFFGNEIRLFGGCITVLFFNFLIGVYIAGRGLGINHIREVYPEDLVFAPTNNIC